MSSSSLVVSTGVPSAEVTLLSHRGEVLARSTAGGVSAADLAPGLYRVQVQTGATLTEEIVSVRGPEVHHRMHLQLPMVTPVKGVSVNNEVHSGPLQGMSMHPFVSYGQGGRIVVFVRVVAPPAGGRPLPQVDHDGLQLLDVRGTPLVSGLPPDRSGPGHAGVTVDVDPGTYLLRTPVGEGRTADQSVVVLGGWTTYLCLPAWPRTPDDDIWVPTATAMVAHLKELDSPFEAYDYGSDAFFAAEAALDGLRSGQLVLPDGEWDMVHANLQLNPMLGVYVAHAAASRPGPPPEQLRDLVAHLRDLLRDHPDVEALHAALKDRDRDMSPSRLTPVEAPPMLRSSYRALVARDAVEPDLLVADSLAERAATAQRADGVWARWDTLGEGVPEVIADPSMLAAAAQAVKALVDIEQEVPPPTDTAWKLGVDRGPGRRTVSREVSEMADVVRRMATHGGRGHKVSIASLSRQLALPRAKVRAALEEISRWS